MPNSCGASTPGGVGHWGEAGVPPRAQDDQEGARGSDAREQRTRPLTTPLTWAQKNSSELIRGCGHAAAHYESPSPGRGDGGRCEQDSYWNRIFWKSRTLPQLSVLPLEPAGKTDRQTDRAHGLQERPGLAAENAGWRLSGLASLFSSSPDTVSGPSSDPITVTLTSAFHLPLSQCSSSSVAPEFLS